MFGENGPGGRSQNISWNQFSMDPYLQVLMLFLLIERSESLKIEYRVVQMYKQIYAKTQQHPWPSDIQRRESAQIASLGRNTSESPAQSSDILTLNEWRSSRLRRAVLWFALWVQHWPFDWWRSINHTGSILSGWGYAWELGSPNLKNPKVTAAGFGRSPQGMLFFNF